MTSAIKSMYAFWACCLGLSRLENNAAAQGETVLALQLIPHFLDRPRLADECGRHSGVVLEALHVLLSHHHGCRDEPTQRSDESAQCSQGITGFFNVTPCHFHAHIVVAASIPAMNETISTTIARPESHTSWQYHRRSEL
jgi:hypothetical protein